MLVLRTDAQQMGQSLFSISIWSVILSLIINSVFNAPDWHVIVKHSLFMKKKKIYIYILKATAVSLTDDVRGLGIVSFGAIHKLSLSLDSTVGRRRYNCGMGCVYVYVR